MNAFSPSANVPSDVADARTCSVMLMDDSSTHHLALALYPVSVSFQRRTRREDITRSRCLSLITSACTESTMVTALKSSTPCHSVSIAFKNCVCSSAERWFQDTSSAFRRLTKNSPCSGLGRRNRKGSVFLVFPDVEASSLLPCFLDVHRSFSSDRHPSSVSVALYRHFVVSRRSFLDHAHVESLSSLDSQLHLHSLLELRRAFFGGMKRKNRFTCLSSSWYFLRSLTPVSMSVPTEVEASASGSAWVSDLELCDGALELAGALSTSGSGCESGIPKRTSMTSPSTTIGSSSTGAPSSVMSAMCRVRPSRTASVRFGSSDVTVSIPSASSLVAGLTCVRLHLCKQFRMCTHTVSFRPGFGSSLRTHTLGPHHPWAPSLRLCMKILQPPMPAVASVVDCGMLSTSLVGQQRLRTHGRLPFA